MFDQDENFIENSRLIPRVKGHTLIHTIDKQTFTEENQDKLVDIFI